MLQHGGLAGHLATTRRGDARRPRAPLAARAQIAPQGLEPGLVDAAAHHVGELGLAARRHIEGRLPVPEGAVAVGHRLQLQGGDVALQRHRGVEDAVGRAVVVVGKRDQLLADVVAVAEMKLRTQPT